MREGDLVLDSLQILNANFSFWLLSPCELNIAMPLRNSKRRRMAWGGGRAGDRVGRSGTGDGKC